MNLAETEWPKLVLKHTVNGACNFQKAANELVEITLAAHTSQLRTAVDLNNIRETLGVPTHEL